MLTQKQRERGITSFAQINFDDPSSVASFAAYTWRQRHYYKHNLERQWFINIAWYMGQQNLVWSDIAKQLVNPKTPPWRVRLVVNLMQGAIRTACAKIYKSRPEWDVIPATSDIVDQQIAELDKHVLENYWQVCRMGPKWLEALWWMLLTGNGFIKPHWNPELGEQLDVSPGDLFQEQMLMPDEVSKLSGGLNGLDELKLGDIDVKVVTPFEIIVDPLATSLGNTRWLLESNIQYVYEVKERWGKTAEDIVPDNNTMGVGDTFHYQRRLQNLTSNSSSILSPNDHREDSVVVHELWIKPHGTGKFKDGRFLVICQDKVLNGDGEGVPFPYRHKKLPYIHLGEIPVPGRFWYASTAEQLVPVQADYNKTKSQLIENRNLMTRPKWLVSDGANIATNALTDEPGEVVVYSGPFKPEPAALQPIPSYVNNMLVEHRRDFEDISGQHEVSRAEAPGEVRSGRGIGMLIQQDETRLGTIIDHLDQALADTGKMVLELACQFVDEERIAKITGTSDEIMVFSFKGSQLLGKNYGRPGADYFDVRIKTIPGLPNSRMAQMQLAQTLIDKQFLGPNDRDLVFRLMGIGNVQNVLDKSRVHRSQALVENQKLLQGIQVPVFTYQDHIAHLEVLDEFRNSIQYQELPDQIKQLFMLHEQQHKMAQAMKIAEPQVLLQRAQQQLMMANGVMQNGQQGIQEGRNQQPQNEVSA